MAVENAGDRGAHEGGTQLTLDIWHPDCWTLQVTAATDAGLLGHGVHEIDGRATGWFTVYGDAVDEVDSLVQAARASPLTASVWEPAETDGGRSATANGAPANVARQILVAYEPHNSINGPLVSRGFIPSDPVRIQDGRESWTVVTTQPRERIRERLDEVRAVAEADVRVVGVTCPDPAGVRRRTDTLSERQREVFELARERGYYHWPREVSAGDLAGDLGVARATLLEHLRKAEAKLLDPPDERALVDEA